MAYLLDTSIIVRRVLTSDPDHPVVKNALRILDQRQEKLYLTPQVLIEFRAVMTRPLSANGLGLSAGAAKFEAENILRIIPLLPDTDQIYPQWVQLVDNYGVIGRQVYDARLVAVMMTHHIPSILTLNPSHFRRFSSIHVVDPQAVR